MTAAARDGLAMAVRNLRHVGRNPQLLVFSTVQPIMFLLMFAFVFGGAIASPGYASYEQFLIPGILVQTIAFGAVATGVGLAEDISKGLMDRFRSMPIARSAVLVGRTLADLARNAFALALMLLVGLLIGFSFDDTLPRVAAAIALIVLFGHAVSWVAATVGILVRDPEATQPAMFLWLFPLVFASSAFVPVESMPAALEAFAEVQPVSLTVDAARALFNGGDATGAALGSLAWSAGLIAVFAPLAVLRYRRSV